MNSRHLFLPLLLGLALPGLAWGDVYKWVDSHGEVHYSDSPLPDAKKLNLPPPPAADHAGPSLADKERAFRQRQVDREEAKKKQQEKQAEAKRERDNCRAARDNLRTLQQGGRIYRYNDKGERVYLDDQARQKAIGEAQQNIRSWCK